MDRKALARRYAERRHKRVQWIRLVLAVSSGLSMVAVVLVAPMVSSKLGGSIGVADVNKFIVGILPAGKATDLLGKLLDRLLSQYQLPFAFGVASLTGWLKLKKKAEAVQSRAFAEFDDSVLARIAAPRPFDPLRGAAGIDSSDRVLPWTLPARGARRDAWDA